MKQRTPRRRSLLALVALLGVALLAIEAYHLSPPIRLQAVALRERVGASDSLVRMLSDSDPHVQLAASDSLVRLGPAAVTALIRGTGHPDGNVRAFALATLIHEPTVTVSSDMP
ncbi:MAG: HEAT repeat domain-containing protein [Planctomycetes bacterium]|nr:HEAT repeat domain-containing protein [Planctomycetota bacterium]